VRSSHASTPLALYLQPMVSPQAPHAFLVDLRCASQHCRAATVAIARMAGRQHTDLSQQLGASWPCATERTAERGIRIRAQARGTDSPPTLKRPPPLAVRPASALFSQEFFEQIDFEHALGKQTLKDG